MMRDFYVYILTNTARVIYIGITNNLSGRFWEHTMDRSSEFCLRYNLDRLKKGTGLFSEALTTRRRKPARH